MMPFTDPAQMKKWLTQNWRWVYPGVAGVAALLGLFSALPDVIDMVQKGNTALLLPGAAWMLVVATLWGGYIVHQWRRAHNATQSTDIALAQQRTGLSVEAAGAYRRSFPGVTVRLASNAGGWVCFDIDCREWTPGAGYQFSSKRGWFGWALSHLSREQEEWNLEPMWPGPLPLSDPDLALRFRAYGDPVAVATALACPALKNALLAMPWPVSIAMVPGKVVCFLPRSELDRERKATARGGFWERMDPDPARWLLAEAAIYDRVCDLLVLAGPASNGATLGELPWLCGECGGPTSDGPAHERCSFCGAKEQVPADAHTRWVAGKGRLYAAARRVRSLDRPWDRLLVKNLERRNHLMRFLWPWVASGWPLGEALFLIGVVVWLGVPILGLMILSPHHQSQSPSIVLAALAALAATLVIGHLTARTLYRRRVRSDLLAAPALWAGGEARCRACGTSLPAAQEVLCRCPVCHTFSLICPEPDEERLQRLTAERVAYRRRADGAGPTERAWPRKLEHLLLVCTGALGALVLATSVLAMLLLSR